MIRALIGTITWMTLNGLGLTLASSFSGILKWIGYFDYVVTGLILLFVVNKYMEGDFFKNLGKDGTEVKTK